MLPRKTKGPHQGCVFLRMIFGHLGERNEKLDIKGKFILPKRLFTSLSPKHHLFSKIQQKKTLEKCGNVRNHPKLGGGGQKRGGKVFSIKNIHPW